MSDEVTFRRMLRMIAEHLRCAYDPKAIAAELERRVALHRDVGGPIHEMKADHAATIAQAVRDGRTIEDLAFVRGRSGMVEVTHFEHPTQTKEVT